MKLDIGNYDVFFPYDYIYPEQRGYMEQLLLSIKNNNSCAIEIAPGYGKEVLFFSSVLAVLCEKSNYTNTKVVFLTQNYQTYLNAFDAFKRVYDYMVKEDVLDIEEKIKCLSLSSKSNLCINDKYCKKRSQDFDIEDICYESIMENQCLFFNNLIEDGRNTVIDNNILSLDLLIEKGNEMKICPFYYAHSDLEKYNIFFVQIRDFLNPKYQGFFETLIPKENTNTILCFDNAQNIEDHVTDAVSLYFTSDHIDNIRKALEKVENDIEKDGDYKGEDKLKQGVIYEEFLKNEEERHFKGKKKTMLDVFSHFLLPIYPNFLYNRVICGSVWNISSVCRILRNVIAFFKLLLEKKKDIKDLNFVSFDTDRILYELQDKAFIEPLTLYFLGPRLCYYLITNNKKNLSKYRPLLTFCELLSSLALHDVKVYSCIVGEHDEVNHKFYFQMALIDVAYIFRKFLDDYPVMVFITTILSTFSSEMYKILGITKDRIPTIFAYDLLVPREVIENSDSDEISKNMFNIYPISVSLGKDRTKLEQKIFYTRTDKSTYQSDSIGSELLRNYMDILKSVCDCTPDGVVAFFTSFEVIKKVLLNWEHSGACEHIFKKKLIFIEPTTRDTQSNFISPSEFEQKCSLVIDDYKRAIDNGRGALLMCVANGRLSKFINFNGQYCRSAIVFGRTIKYDTLYHLTLRAKFLSEQSDYLISTEDYFGYLSARDSTSDLQRIVGSKTDYCVIVLADIAFSEQLLTFLPVWIYSTFSKNQKGCGAEEMNKLVKQFFLKAHRFVWNKEARQIPND